MPLDVGYLLTVAPVPTVRVFLTLDVGYLFTAAPEKCRFQIGQGCILSPCLFNLYAEYVMRKLGWRKHKLESRLPGEISITSDMQMTPPLWQKVKRN